MTDGKTVNQVVAWNIARWRKQAGLTQEELGRRLGWSNASVSAAERSWDGKRVREFDADTLLALSSALGVPLIALLLPPPGTDGPAMAELFARLLPETPDDSRVMEAYRAALAGAAEQHLDIPEAASLIGYLQDMTDPDHRHAAAAKRVSDMRAFEREYRRRMIAYHQEQIADLRAGAEEEP